MNSFTLIVISILSGVIAGEILAGINLFVVEPYIDKAIGIEVKRDIAKGEQINFHEFNAYRIWQKSGTFVAAAFLGVAYGAMIGVAYVFTRKFIPSSDDRKKAIILASLMCLALYIVPFIKYPANPPAVGNPETIGLRENLYVSYQITSGIITLGVGALFYKFRKVNHIVYIIPAMYIVLISCTYLIFPPNPDKISISMELVNSFRIVTASTMTVFWILLGVVFGLLWYRFKPHGPSKIAIN